jgi:hypothetical protein
MFQTFPPIQGWQFQPFFACQNKLLYCQHLWPNYLRFLQENMKNDTCAWQQNLWSHDVFRSPLTTVRRMPSRHLCFDAASSLLRQTWRRPWRNTGVPDIYRHWFLTPALVGSGWWASCAGRLILSERVSGTHWTEDYMGPTAGMDVLNKRNISCPVPGIKPWIVKPAA